MKKVLFTLLVCFVALTACQSTAEGYINDLNDLIEKELLDKYYSNIERIKVLKEKDNIIFVGDGSEICYNYLKNDYNNIFLSDINSRYCIASSVGMCANEKNAMKAENIAPAYLRLPQAQRNLKKG